MPQADATALIFKARAEAVARTPARETASDFAARFEKAYADEMDWRNSRGGPTLDEIKRIAAEKGMEVEDEVLEAQFADTRARAIRDLEIALREKYLETSNLSAMEWEHKRQRIAFIHEKLTPEMLETYVYEWELVDDEDEELEEPIFNSTNFAPQREFVTLNQKAPDGKRFEKIGELDHPVKADVYLAPRIIREDDD
jgi:hypothetical protein